MTQMTSPLSRKRPNEEPSGSINAPVASNSASSSSKAIDLTLSSVTYQGFKYTKKEEHNGRTSYRCTKYRGSSKHPVKPQCKATLMLHADGDMIVNNVHERGQK
jgi:hypothetical protein